MALKMASPVSGASPGVSRREKAVSWTPSASPPAPAIELGPEDGAGEPAIGEVSAV